MTWIAVAVPVLVVAFVLTAWPHEAWVRAGRLARRADGSTSARRQATERSERRRVLVRGVVFPVVAAFLVGGAGVALHEWVPWSATAAIFGTATPETDLVARSLFEDVEARAREAAEQAANRVPDEFRVPGQIGVREWLFQHFPLHPIWLAFVAAAVVWLVRWVLAERARYLRGLRSRMRAYQRHDLRRLRRPADAAPPA
ncbi:hypothetical protein RQM47_09330 [Rubrivirga sp. S365]|uniref:hypothetical protein n=1 Tax=Rubrivirga sp. S365 TaxID=3076080 RepID=UPI0028C603E0|nr:hypothetical protein [Rubrivirga sp. S365]MDT7856841.1 hypothetical protein [Rubrivirga sp. S365]